MTTKQKIWLWIGLALFLVPEILWSPLGNFWYSFLSGGKVLRNSLIIFPDSITFLSGVLFLQMLGCLFFSMVGYKSKTILGYVVTGIFGVLLLCYLFSALFIIALSRISIP